MFILVAIFCGTNFFIFRDIVWLAKHRDVFLVVSEHKKREMDESKYKKEKRCTFVHFQKVVGVQLVRKIS